MTRPMPSGPTPDQRLDAAIRHALAVRRRSLASTAALRSGSSRALEAADRHFLAAMKTAAGEYAACLIEECARSPYPPPGVRGGGAA